MAKGPNHWGTYPSLRWTLFRIKKQPSACDLLIERRQRSWRLSERIRQIDPYVQRGFRCKCKKNRWRLKILQYMIIVKIPEDTTVSASKRMCSKTVPLLSPRQSLVVYRIHFTTWNNFHNATVDTSVFSRFWTHFVTAIARCRSR